MDFDDGVLIITDSISVNATVVAWAIQHFSVELKDLRIITQASLLEGNLNFKSSSLSTIISISEKPGFHSQLWLLELAKVLKPGGYVFLQEPSFFHPNQEYVLGEIDESRACLERNLLFAGFYLIEGFECLDHSAEINQTSQDFELIAIKAKRTYDAEEFSTFQKTEARKVDNSIIPIGGSLQPQIEEMDDFIDENSLLTEEDPKRPELPQDESYFIRERIRERNRLYQRRRRARMTEEQKKREKEKRRQYMQSRRVQPVSYEMPLPIPVSCAAEECEQSLLCGQQLRGSHIIDMEHNQVVGASEAL
ncbi:anamorsin homolog 2-like [Cornus florida]|uniref:anamorsin homolog 2-like n=1 Tax=Cornus florida TaxID=4283 RepID=UPI00289D7B5E|nr:anamorsin homolog 2-like [Cornus florida]